MDAHVDSNCKGEKQAPIEFLTNSRPNSQTSQTTVYIFSLCDRYEFFPSKFNFMNLSIVQIMTIELLELLISRLVYYHFPRSILWTYLLCW